MTSPLCVATGGWCRRVFHYRPPTPMYRNSPPLCTIVLQIPSLMPLKMRKVQQNVYALTEVVRDRLGDARFLPFLDYLFSQFTAEESREIEAARGKSTLLLERRFNPPRFNMGAELDAKVIEMNITINDKRERFELSQQEFFERLTATCGNESIIPIERLRQRVDDLAESV